MQEWYDFARGPLLRLALIVGILGLIRHTAVALWGMVDAVRHAQDKRIPCKEVMLRTLGWMFPFLHLHRSRFLYSLVSFLFHAGLLLSALFLFEHLTLIRQNTGLGWPAMTRRASDVFTLVALLTGTIMLGMRVWTLESRKLSRFMDYALMVLLLFTMASGGVASRAWNPFSYAGTMFVHVTGAALIFFLMPFTKLTHCVLFPLIRLSTEIAWHFRPTAGDDVLLTLHGTKERTI